MLSPKDQVITVITKPGNRSPIVAEMKAAGAEVWNNAMIRASYEGLKKARPNNPYKDMRSLYGTKKGETLFVCGSGPSLNTCPEKLPGTTFAINRAISRVKADYWCFSDVKPTRDHKDHPNTKTAEWAFSSSLHCVFKDAPGYLIEATGDPLNYKLEEKRPLYWNGATFSWTLHWAMKMMPKRIVIIGCEFSLDGYHDGSPILPTSQMGARIISEVARCRVDDMFGEDKPHWFDPSIEILDASGGYLPLPKVKLEDYL